MKKSSGIESFPIWLVGDSPPAKWEDKLDVPFDSRHPTRHSIWTPIENIIQRELFASSKLRLRSEDIYIINAVDNADDKRESVAEWKNLKERMSFLQNKISSNRPKFILTFGQFSFEFMRRVLCRKERHSLKTWTCEKLGEQFRNAVDRYPVDEPVLVPLLHATIARGKYLEAHSKYCSFSDPNPNYFEYVGRSLAKQIERKFSNEDIWAY